MNDPVTDDEKALMSKLMNLYPDSMDDARQWLHSPNRMLGGETPWSRWQAGRVEDVLQVLEMLESGAFG